MSYEEVTRRMVRVLKDAKIPYMIVGGLAANYYGCPRATYDLDLVVELDEAGAKRLVKLASRARFRLHEKEVLALTKVGNRFVMESWEKYRIDFWLVKTTFDREVFGRRQRAKIFGMLVWISTPEDLILQKLRSARPRDLEDIQAILVRHSGKLDESYLKQKAAELDLTRILEEQVRQARGG
jgi:hypothetical protein